MRKLLLVSLIGLSLVSVSVYAQNNAEQSNPYLLQMQKTLDAENSKAVAKFNQQFPKPEPSELNTKYANTKPPTGSQIQPSTTPTQPKPQQTYKPQQESQPVTSTTTTPSQPDIAVTTTKKDEKEKSSLFNIFGTPGSNTSSTQSGQSESQGTPNIFR